MPSIAWWRPASNERDDQDPVFRHGCGRDGHGRRGCRSQQVDARHLRRRGRALLRRIHRPSGTEVNRGNRLRRGNCHGHAFESRVHGKQVGDPVTLQLSSRCRGETGDDSGGAHRTAQGSRRIGLGSGSRRVLGGRSFGRPSGLASRQGQARKDPRRRFECAGRLHCWQRSQGQARLSLHAGPGPEAHVRGQDGSGRLGEVPRLDRDGSPEGLSVRSAAHPDQQLHDQREAGTNREPPADDADPEGQQVAAERARAQL